jgi:hypothetical protein
MKLTLNQLLRHMKEKHVAHLHDIASVGDWAPELKLVGEGAFRRAYSVDKLPIVVKFPCIYGDSHILSGKDWKYCVKHTKNEILAYHTILADNHYSGLRRFLPKIHYYNFETGVTVMQRYEVIDEGCKEIETYEKEIAEFLKQKDIDGHFGNWGYEIIGRKRRYRMLDLGELLEIVS